MIHENEYQLQLSVVRKKHFAVRHLNADTLKCSDLNKSWIELLKVFAKIIFYKPEIYTYIYICIIQDSRVVCYQTGIYKNCFVLHKVAKKRF